jgi:hypothetical protein
LSFGSRRVDGHARQFGGGDWGPNLRRGNGESGELFDLASAVEKREDADDAKGTIYEPPAEGNAAHTAGDERKGDDEDTSDDTELDDPDIFDGVEIRADEGDGEDNVREGEPVRPVSEEGKLGIGLDKGVAHFYEPVSKAGIRMGGGELGKNFEFGFERESGDAADDQAENKKCETQANAFELGGGHEGKLGRLGRDFNEKRVKKQVFLRWERKIPERIWLIVKCLCGSRESSTTITVKSL